MTDEVVSSKPVPAYVEDQCKRGAKVQFQASVGTDHSTTSIVFAGDAYNFMERAFNGTLELNACNNTLGVDALPGSDAFIEAIGPEAWALLQMLQGASSSSNSTATATAEGSAAVTAPATATGGASSVSLSASSATSVPLSSLSQLASSLQASATASASQA